MLKAIIGWAGAGLVQIIIFVLALRWAFRAGQNHTRASKAEEINNAALKASQSRNRLRHDDEYAQRVRRRFTR